jgi:diguanylate cyclase (GGDEF)-like protein
MLSMMELLRRYGERMRRRPDSEHNQALLRAVIVTLLLLNTAWVAGQQPERAARLWTINVASVAFSLLLLARIVQRPEASPARRVLGAVHDNAAIAAWLFSGGPMGALALFVFPFVTVGNGFRYGVRYLACSGLLGAAGIGTLVIAAPAWRSHGMIGAGVLLSHVVVTIYTGALLGRLRRTQEQLEKAATSDALTGLPNRRFFMDRLSHMVLAHDRASMACLYLDLDGFKGVNDRCGHEVGDQLLARVADEVVRCIHPTDMLARLGGDEFTVVLDGPPSADYAKRVADRIIRGVEAIRTVDGHVVDVSVSIGISFIPAGPLARRVCSEELLRAADEAMYVAKRSGKGRYRFMDLEAGVVVPAA